MTIQDNNLLTTQNQDVIGTHRATRAPQKLLAAIGSRSAVMT